MAEKQVSVDIVQCFHSDELGIEIAANQRMEVRADLASKWIEEGKALPVSQALIETPEDAGAHETADIKRKKK